MAPFRYAGMLGLIAFAVCAGASPIAYATTASGESAASGETATMQRIVDTFERIVTRVYQTSGHGVRGAHAKGQGCVHATVRVAANVAPPLRHGVFAAPKTYRAWIRFSNGAGEIRADGVPDGRGMAIKLTGVPGPKLIDDERQTQDFVMINFPAFFISDVAQYEVLANAIERNQLPAFLAAHPKSAKLAAQIGGVPTHDLLRNNYFSMTPYLLGSTYLKFGAFPASCTTGAELTP
ncbi:MAG TPA: catalase, partial [Candidatus Cybelea sp.]